ncbi:MAG: ribonuclease P protein component [Bacteroidales bacterium]|nr:ribonuclease P protein component [Bacteroidales bacterium]
MRLFHRKNNRLYIEREIETLFRDGLSHFIYPIKILYLTYPIKDGDYKVLISVSKRNFKRAVDRNLIKRRTKEAFRKNSFHLKNSLEEKELGIYIAFIYVSKVIIDYKAIEDLVIKQILYLTNRIEGIEHTKV